MSEADPRSADPCVSELLEQVDELQRRLAAFERGAESHPGRAVHGMIAFLRNTPDAIYIKDAEGRYIDVSDSFLALTSRSRKDVIGSTDHDLFEPDIAARFAEEDRQVRQSGEPCTFRQSLTYGGQELTFSTRKFLLPGGEVAGISTNLTDQLCQERSHQQIEHRLSLALEGTGVAVYENDLGSGSGTWSEAAFHILGVDPPADLVGSYHVWRQAVHADDLDSAEQAHAAAERRGGPWTLEHRIVRQDTGEVRWLSTYGHIIARDGARISTGAAIDITERKRAEEKLEAQTATLATLNEVCATVGAELDLDRIVQKVTDAGVELTRAQFGAFFYNFHSENGELLTLYTLSGAPRSDFEQFPHPRATQVFKPTFDGTEIVRSGDITKDPRYGHNKPYHGMPPKHLPVRSYLAVPVKSRSGEVIGGLFFGHAEADIFDEKHEHMLTAIAAQAAVAMDNARLYREARHEIDRRKRAEKHQQLLIGELNHRVKNTLSIVQSLAMQSFRADVPPDVGRSSFEARLAALSTAHNLLTRENWERASFSETIKSAIAATAGSGLTRVHLDGPDFDLPPQAALSVAMIIHELCTNAIKYGALCTPAGRVDLSWSLKAEDKLANLTIIWRESGGPPVKAPRARGFGTRLIQRGLSAELSGEAKIEFPPEGVICTIEARIAQDSE
jgi:PAS domain S-box-containing protein